MATTQNTYTGNGSNKLFSITFPYLDTADIDVFLNGTLQTVTTQYFFANATTVEFVTAPANGATVLLKRSTDDAALQATFFPGSSIKASDLNADFDQVLFIAQETTNAANAATSTAASATTTANSALSASASAVSTANTASSNASAAASTANTASTNASNAVTTANAANSTSNTANTNANAAVVTANTASSNASTALSTANTASSNASAAVSTANTASTNASAAVSTANAASSTANTASSNASTAVTAANNAVTTANTANSNSSAAVTTANAAAAAVANSVLYSTVANVAAIPASPANNDAVEVTNSTGIQSFTPLSGTPAGFVGSSGLSVRIIFQTAGSTWVWIQYFPNDPENRYLGKAGGTMTGALVLSGAPTVGLNPTTKTYVDAADGTLTTAAAAAQSTANAALPKSGGTMTGGIVFSGAQGTATTTTAGIVQLTDSTSSTSITTAATPNSVKTVADLANAALPKASGAMTGTPTAPTAPASTNTTQIATTAYVLGQASSTTPVMNGTAAVGVGTTFARADHVHASDTSRAPLASPSFTGTLSFNSGYGSSAVAYGCRAWVNFNGTGTVSIRGSGNVSSITDNGTGDYTVNFTTAMVDANYATVGTAGQNSGDAQRYLGMYNSNTTTSTRIFCAYPPNSQANDVEIACVAIFR